MLPLQIKRHRVAGLLLAGLLLPGLSPMAADAATAASAELPGHFIAPARLSLAGDDTITYENGFLLVPENRARPDARRIAVRYLRFPAQAPAQGAAPVVMLPGGPGSVIAEAALRDGTDLVRTIRHVTRTRDFVILQQRGVVDGPHGSGLTYPVAALPLDRAPTAAELRQRLRDGVRQGLAQWTELGVDLQGYTVLEMVADVEDLRRVLAAEQIVLYGTSFGSQWSLSYIKLHQDRVERAVLTGLEPLDYAYDSPQGIWDTLDRIGQAAAASPELGEAFRNVSLTQLYQRVVERLERNPQRATIRRPDGEGTVAVVVGAEDLRQVLYPIQGDLRASAEAWPRLLLELDRGDYRYLALLAYQSRQAGRNGLLALLVDNGLGISAAREAGLDREPARRWLGDINAGYVNSRDLTPTPDVGDDVRADFDLNIPALYIQGNIDLSTPLENALGQRERLKHGRIVVVDGGTHSVRREIMAPELGIPELGQHMLQFMSPGDGTDAGAVLAKIPQQAALVPFRFASLQSPSLYERWLAKHDGR